MKLLFLLSLLSLSLVHEGTSTHLETCECHEIREVINATVQQAAAHLEYKLSLVINSAIDNINTTDDGALQDLESSLTSTMERLLKPIQTQLDYHLPPPPSSPLRNSEDHPAASCKELHEGYPDAPSGYYWIGQSGSPVSVYCDMTRTCGDLTGGWMRVANIDMTNTSQQCPSGFRLTSSPKRVCDITSYGCASASLSVHQTDYSHVCGRIIGYQHTTPIAFAYGSSRDIDNDYVFGVSLTHGQNPRKHIWTFAGAIDEAASDPSYKCPCINTNISPPPSIPSFVGRDYFCDTAQVTHYSTGEILYPSDPL